MFYRTFADGPKDPQESCVRVELLPPGVAPHISAGLVDIPQGGENDSNPHFDKTQIYFVLEGKGSFYLDGKMAREVEPESVVEVPVGVRHIMRADRGTPVRYVYINDPLESEQS
jgi:quercetin dioxygenase-like cupin family protein